MGFLGFQESKTNPKATARSVLHRSIRDALICGFFALIVLVMKDAFVENWGYVIVFALIGAFVGALWEWQDGPEAD
jgi:hypothetical protein